MTGKPWGSLSTIRVRLTAALAVALLPVLLLGVLQSAIAFHRENASLKVNLGAAAQRSAAAARARLEGADILLQTLAPGSIGFQCAQRLQQVMQRVPGYANLIRFDREGRVACAGAGVPADPLRARRAWFQRLAAGESVEMTRETGQAYASEPAVLAAIRDTGPNGEFAGAFAAVIRLASLRPSVNDPSLPSNSEVALVDPSGHIINVTSAAAFGPIPRDWRERMCTDGSSTRQEAALSTAASRRSLFSPRSPTPRAGASLEATTRTSCPTPCASSATQNASAPASTITRDGGRRPR